MARAETENIAQMTRTVLAIGITQSGLKMDKANYNKNETIGLR